MAVTSNSGRLHDLTEANRFDPNLERERELLALRHHVAVERLQHPGPLVRWTPLGADCSSRTRFPSCMAQRSTRQSCVARLRSTDRCWFGS